MIRSITPTSYHVPTRVNRHDDVSLPVRNWRHHRHPFRREKDMQAKSVKLYPKKKVVFH